MKPRTSGGVTPWTGSAIATNGLLRRWPITARSSCSISNIPATCGRRSIIIAASCCVRPATESSRKPARSRWGIASPRRDFRMPMSACFTAAAPNHKISTLDLQRAFEQVMPASLGYEGHKSLDWFFDSWVNGDSIPQFSLDGVHMTPSGHKLKVTGTILEDHAAKDMVTAVPLYAVDATGHSRF